MRENKSPDVRARAKTKKRAEQVKPFYPAEGTPVNARLCLVCGYFRPVAEKRRRGFCAFTGETASGAGSCEFWNQAGGEA